MVCMPGWDLLGRGQGGWYVCVGRWAHAEIVGAAPPVNDRGQFAMVGDCVGREGGT